MLPAVHLEQLCVECMACKNDCIISEIC